MNAQRIAFLDAFDANVFALSAGEAAAADDDLVVRPAQLAVVGDFVSRRWGKFKISETDIDQMIRNFEKEHPQAPTELSVDYDHTEGKAAGWVKRLYKKYRTVAGRRIAELWGDIGWTKPAATHIGQKEYRFFSPMFDRDFITPVGKRIGCCLTGGAITNRPFLQGMASVQLSAAISEDAAVPFTSSSTGAKRMALHKIKDKDGNEVEVDLDVLKTDPEILKLSQKASETPADNKTAALDPNIKALSDAVAKQNESIVKLSEAIANRDKQDRRSEAERLLDEAIRTGRLLPVEKETYMLLSETEAGMGRIKKLSERAKNSVIKLRAERSGTTTFETGREDGSAGDDDDGEITVENAEKLFEEAVAKAQKDAGGPLKLSYADAMKQVEQEQPDLARKFQLSFRRQ